MIRHHARVWLTSPHAPAAGGVAALVIAAALLALAIVSWRAIPLVNVAVVMLLPLGLGGSVVITILLPPRPPRVARAARVGHQTPAPGRATHTVRVGGARCGQATPRPGQRPAKVTRASSPGRVTLSQPAFIRLGIGGPGIPVGQRRAFPQGCNADHVRNPAPALPLTPGRLPLGRANSQPAEIRLGLWPAAATPEGEAAAAGSTSPPGARPTRTPVAGRAPGSHLTNENARRLQPAGGKGSR